MNACCCWKHSAYSVFSRGSIKGDHFISMSISIMSPQMLPRKVFIFTFMTGIVYSLIKDKPNTYWSKRSGHPELSNIILDDSKNYTKEAEINKKNIMDYRTHEQRRNILSKNIKSDEVLSLPFLRLKTLLRQIKYHFVMWLQKVVEINLRLTP